MLTQSFILGFAILAQAGNIDGILGNAMGIIARVAYVIAFCMFVYGCVRARADLGEAAIGAIVLQTLFAAGGLPTIQIQ